MFQDELVNALAFGGGEDAALDITQALDAETQFWRETGPTLKAGWPMGKGLKKDTPEGAEKLNTLHAHDRHAEHLVKVLKKLDCASGNAAVARFEETWKTMVPDRTDPEDKARLKAEMKELERSLGIIKEVN